MQNSERKNLALNIFVWTFISYPFGYLIGAIVATVIFIDFISPQIYLFGFFISIFLFLILGSIFAVLATIWLLLSKKYNLDESWFFLSLFTLFIGIINTIVLYFLFGKMSIPFIAAIALPSGWFGTLLPRILFKRLKPGSLTPKL